MTSPQSVPSGLPSSTRWSTRYTAVGSVQLTRLTSAASTSVTQSPGWATFTAVRGSASTGPRHRYVSVVAS